MELSELIEKGVDLSDPRNYNTYTFKVTLTFKEKPLPILFTGTGIDAGIPIPLHADIDSGSVGPGGGINVIGGGMSVNIVLEGDGTRYGRSPSIYILSTTQSVSWLKDMYNVELSVMNHSDTGFSITNASATLGLPEGLSLAATKSGQTMTTNLDDIKGQHSVRASWVVRGDKTGTYDISASFHGLMQPFNEPIDRTFVARQDVVVEGGNGLHIDVYPETSLYIGEKYYIQFALRNESDRNFYNVTTTFGEYVEPERKSEIIIKNPLTGEVSDRIVETAGTEYRCASASKCKQVPVLNGGDKVSVGVFSPGEVLYGTYETIPEREGENDAYYYELIRSLVESLEGENLGVTVDVHWIDSHISKYVCYSRQHGNGISDDESMETVGDPVDVSTGAFTQEINALNVKGSTQLSLDLHYNSMMAQTAGEGGYGWSHSYEQRIVDKGVLLELHMTPYSTFSFINDEANEKQVYGYKTGDKIVLEDISSFGHYSPSSDAMKGWDAWKDENGYTLTDAATGNVYLFDTEGRLTKMTQKDGKGISLGYGTDKTTITDRISGEKLILTYQDGKLTKVQDNHGREASFGYDDRGDLVKFTDILGNKTVMEYDDSHHFLKATDQAGTVLVENTYDSEGRVLTQKEAGSSKKTLFSYEDTADGGMHLDVTDRMGATLSYESDERGNIIKYVDAEGGITEKLYDKNDNLLTETAPDGSRVMYEYDEENRRTALYDTAGNATRMTYDGDGNVIKVENDRGDTSFFTYNEKGQLTQTTGNGGSRTDYTYDSNGYVTRMTTQGLGTILYDYDKKGKLLSQTDYNGNVTAYAYDDYGNIIQTTDGAGNITKAEYNEAGWLLKSTDAMGTETEYTYDHNGNILTETTNDRTISYTYDKAGRLKTLTSAAGDVTRYKYDDRGNLVELTYPDGTKSSYTYDSRGNLLTETDPDGKEHSYSYDCMNHVTREVHAGLETVYDYYPNGKVYKATYPDGQTATYTYDCNWNVILVTDRDNNTVQYEYDSLGNVTKTTDSLGNTYTAVYDKNGRMISETDPNGNTTAYAYDGNGNCIEKTNPLGLVSTMEYDGADRLVKVTVKTKDGDISVSYGYDKNGRCINTTDARGNTSHVEYDDYGNPITMTDAMGNVVQTNRYDSIDQLTTGINALGTATVYSYDKNGNVTSMTEGEGENGQTYSYGYDAANRLTDAVDPLKGTSAYHYDERGNLTTVTDPMGGETTYRYDEMNRLIYECTAIGSETLYHYNARGLLSEAENARGQKTEYTYDATRRITEKKDELGRVTYTYDANGNVLTVTDKNGTISRTYDELNRVKTCTDYKGNTVSYGYDELGNRISITYPGGEIVRYTYDADGNLTTVTDWQDNRTSYEYNANNYLTKTTRPDGSTEEYTYNKAGYVTRQIDKAADKTVIHDYRYTYDGHGNITQIQGRTEGDTSLIADASMTYDKDNRLATYNGETVTYDADGNMTHGPLNGRMADYEYDCRNRLVRVTEEDGIVTEYEYDAENTRTAVIKDSIKTEYVTDKNTNFSQTLTETDYQKTLFGYTDRLTTKTYTYGTGLISEQKNNASGNAENNSETLYYHYNNLGSTTELTDETGRIVYRFAYGTYGELTGIYDATGNSLITCREGDTKAQCLTDAIERTGITFLYNGRYGVMTDTNGLYYMRARYYNTDIKRFINRDIIDGSIANSPSLNKYSYVQGNPVTQTDPFGLSPYGNGQGTEWSEIGHTILDIAGFFWDGADLLNAAWYLAEGNMQMAIACGIAAIPIAGSLLGGATKAVMGVEKAAKAVKLINKVTTLATFTATATITGIDTYYALADAKASYDAGTLTVGEAAGAVGMAALTATLGVKSAKSAVGLANALHETGTVRKALNSVADGFTKMMHDNRGCVDLSCFSKNKGKDALVSKSGRTTIPSQQQMHDAVTQWARMEESLANSNRQLDKFNTATVVYDARTGNYYYGMNRGVQLSGDTLNSSLASWLPESSLNQYRLGNCAEVDAVNQALNSGANASDLYLYTINTKNNVSKPMCENCIYTFADRVADVFSH